MATSLNPELISKNRDEIEDVRVKIQQDYARVDIYYQTLNLKEIMQSPTISVCIKIFIKSIVMDLSNYLMLFIVL